MVVNIGGAVLESSQGIGRGIKIIGSSNIKARHAAGAAVVIAHCAGDAGIIGRVVIVEFLETAFGVA